MGLYAVSGSHFLRQLLSVDCVCFKCCISQPVSERLGNTFRWKLSSCFGNMGCELVTLGKWKSNRNICFDLLPYIFSILILTTTNFSRWEQVGYGKLHNHVWQRTLWDCRCLNLSCNAKAHLPPWFLVVRTRFWAAVYLQSLLSSASIIRTTCRGLGEDERVSVSVRSAYGPHMIN